jgi:septum formation protein
MKLILASQSPRRRELIKGLDLPFAIAANYECNEVFPANLPAGQVAEYLALKKSEACPFALNDGDILVTADTLVKCDEQLLGKPADRAEAVAMLKKLSGRGHEVITGVCLRSVAKMLSFSTVSQVFFATLNDADIEYYVDKYQPFDKAGAYGIQEWIGYTGIEKIEGSYYNVMGLPVAQLWQKLKTFL